MTRTFPLLRECLAFAVAVARFYGRRGIAAALLVSPGAVLEGLGILLLVPVLTTLFDARLPAGVPMLGRLSGWIPPDLSPLQRLALLLALFSALVLLRAFVLRRRESLLGDLQVGFVAGQRATLARRLGGALISAANGSGWPWRGHSFARPLFSSSMRPPTLSTSRAKLRF